MVEVFHVSERVHASPEPTVLIDHQLSVAQGAAGQGGKERCEFQGGDLDPVVTGVVQGNGVPAGRHVQDEETPALVRDLTQRRTADADLRSRVRILGPAPAGLTRLQGRFRWQILIKSCGRAPLLHLLQQLRRAWPPPARSRLSLTLDIDPSSLF